MPYIPHRGYGDVDDDDDDDDDGDDDDNYITEDHNL